MLTVYEYQAGAVRKSSPSLGMPLPPAATWIDLSNPTPQSANDRTALGSDPGHEKMHEIEMSSRLSSTVAAPYMIADVVTKAETNTP